MALTTIEPNNELLGDRDELLRDRLLDSRYKAALFYSAYCEESTCCAEDITPALIQHAIRVRLWIQTADQFKAEIERRGGKVDGWPARQDLSQVAKCVDDMDALVEEAATKTRTGIKLVH